MRPENWLLSSGRQAEPRIIRGLSGILNVAAGHQHSGPSPLCHCLKAESHQVTSMPQKTCHQPQYDESLTHTTRVEELEEILEEQSNSYLCCDINQVAANFCLMTGDYHGLFVTAGGVQAVAEGKSGGRGRRGSVEAGGGLHVRQQPLLAAGAAARGGIHPHPGHAAAERAQPGIGYAPPSIWPPLNASSLFPQHNSTNPHKTPLQYRERMLEATAVTFVAQHQHRIRLVHRSIREAHRGDFRTVTVAGGAGDCRRAAQPGHTPQQPDPFVGRQSERPAGAGLPRQHECVQPYLGTQRLCAIGESWPPSPLVCHTPYPIPTPLSDSGCLHMSHITPHEG